MAFAPFFGGQRICLGKTFAMTFMKCALPIVISQLDFTFVDKIMYEKKPANTLPQKETTIYVNVIEI